MDSLQSAYKIWMETQAAVPEDGRYIPEDGICLGCDRLKKNHDGVERVLAIRKLKYFDVTTQGVITKGAIPYCNCQVPEYRQRRR